MSFSFWSGWPPRYGKRLPSARLRDVWPNHFHRIDDTVEFSLSDKAKLQSRGLESEILIHGVVSDLRGFVVADDGRKCRHQHERTFDILVDLLQIRLGALDQELPEVHATVGHDRYRVGDVEDHQRLVDVHSEVAAGATESHRDVVRHHLHGDHSERLALGRIDLAWHDRGARFVFRNLQFRKSGARTARHQTDVVGD